MFGDGSLSRTERSVQIAITGNKFDDEVYLLEHVRPLFQGVFDLELTSRYRHGENTMDLYRYSKEVALTLHSWGMPIGLKKLENLNTKSCGGGESVRQGRVRHGWLCLPQVWTLCSGPVQDSFRESDVFRKRQIDNVRPSPNSHSAGRDET